MATVPAAFSRYRTDATIFAPTVPFLSPGDGAASASIQSVLTAARDAAARGIREIILTGVNTGDFGRGSDETFFELLQALEEVEEVERFRISSIEPNLLTDEIIRFVASSRRFMPHFHVPLQSGSNEVLHLMKRRYDRELFADKVREIKTLLPRRLHRRGRDSRYARRNPGSIRGCTGIHRRAGCVAITRVSLLGT